MKNKIVVGNLKMNLVSLDERDKYLDLVKKEFKEIGKKEVDIIICPPAVHLEAFGKKLKTKNISIGAQNIFWEDKGSYTGEISPLMVKNFGAEFVIIGHSERRKYLGETNANINLKIKAALKNGLRPIVCVGESKEQRDNGIATEIIIEQITEGLAELSAYEVASVIIAYEPVWAIGSDEIPTSDQILEIKILLKKIFADMFGLETAEKMHVLYGGSVKAEVLKQTCLDPGLDGVLVGRESLIPREFMKIVKTLTN